MILLHASFITMSKAHGLSIIINSHVPLGGGAKDPPPLSRPGFACCMHINSYTLFWFLSFHAIIKVVLINLQLTNTLLFCTRLYVPSHIITFFIHKRNPEFYARVFCWWYFTTVMVNLTISVEMSPKKVLPSK